MARRFISADEIQFGRDILPILQTHCIRCHGPEVQEANVRLDNLSINLIEDRAVTESWHEVLNVLHASEMPPKDEPQLSGNELSAFTDWVSSSLKVALAARQKTDGRVVLRRLNRVEYQHTTQGLLGLEMDYARDLPPDAMATHRASPNSVRIVRHGSRGPVLCQPGVATVYDPSLSVDTGGWGRDGAEAWQVFKVQRSSAHVQFVRHHAEPNGCRVPSFCRQHGGIRRTVELARLPQT